MLPLRWPQVDFAGGFVRLESGTTKKKQSRAFPLVPELRLLLERRFPDGRPGLLRRFQAAVR